MTLFTVSNLSWLLLGLFACCTTTDAFLSSSQHRLLIVATTPSITRDEVRHWQLSPPWLLHASFRGTKSGRGARGGRRRRLPPHVKRPRKRYVVEVGDPQIKWDRIPSSHLFEVFDPSRKGGSATTKRRTFALQRIKNERILTSILNSWARHRASHDAGERYHEILRHLAKYGESCHHLRPNVFHYNAVINAYAKRNQAKEADSLLKEMLKNKSQVQPNVCTFNSVMNAWSKSNEEDAPERCKELLTEMSSKSSSSGNKHHLAPDTASYNSLVSAYAVRGRAREAEAVLREMLNSSEVEHDARTVNLVMNAWSKSDEDDAPERCEELIVEMRGRASLVGKRELAPDTVTYNTMIDAYAIRGRAREAEEALREMLRTSDVVARSGA